MTRKVSYAIGMAALAGAALSLSCSPSIPKYEFPYAEMRAELDNGMKLVVMPDDSTPLIQVDIRYNTGSNQDPDGKAGIAHFAEHMMFQYKIFGKDKPAIFEILPQITTFFNAFTGTDTTHYMLQGRKEELKTFIRIEAARMVGDCRALPPEEFEREREVVRNELRQRYGRPEAEIPRLIHHEVFPKGHPYYHLGIGDDEQLASVTLEDVCLFLDEYYVPQNATVVVAGSVDPEEVRKQVIFAFGEIKKGKNTDGSLKKVTAHEIPVPEIKYRKVEVELPVERPMVHIVWALPPQYSAEGENINALFLAAAMVSSFNVDWDFAEAVYPQYLGGSMAPLFVISIQLKNQGKLNEALSFVWKATKQAHRPFESGNYTESKNRQIGQFISRFENLRDRTVQVAEMVQFRKDFEWDSEGTLVFEEFQRIQQQDPGDARSFVKKTLSKRKALVLVVKKNDEATSFKKASLEFTTKSHDKAPEPLVDPAEAKRPLVVPKEESALVKARRFQLKNGMRVVMLDTGKMPVVSMQLVFEAGAAHEPKGKGGLAGVAADFLNQAQGSEIGKIGASWGASVSDDTTTFTVSGINIYTKEMIVGLERLIHAGDYSQKGIEVWQKRQKAAFEFRAFRQQRAFTREIAMAVWGPNHPYAVKGMATKSSIGKIGRDEAIAFKKKHYTAKNATLIIAGKFDSQKAEEAIRWHFGEWGGGHKDEVISTPTEDSAGSRAIGVIGDKLPQVSVAIQFPGPAGVDGQQAARTVLGEMMRLKMFEIRTELGSTYGIGAARQTKLGPSRYIAQGGVQSERAGETLKVMRGKIQELRDGVEFDAVFAQARRNVLKRLLAESTVSSALAGRLGQIATYSQNPDYFEKLTKYVAVLSPAQVKSLVTAELKPENEVVAVMGDKETLEKTFTEAGIDNVKYVDVSE